MTFRKTQKAISLQWVKIRKSKSTKVTFRLADYKDSTTQVVSGSYGYDAVNRLTSLTWYGMGGSFNSAGGYNSGGYGGYFESMSWGYDVNNRVASMTNLDYPNENLSYTYDHDSQLTNAVASYGGYGGYGGLGGGTYSWDNNGDSTKSGWITGAGNRLLFDGTYSYVYDKSGNIVQRSTSTAETDYFWDTRGRLSSVTDYTKSGTTLTQIQQVDYGYDAFNDLISRTLTPYSGGNPQTPQVARFVYDLAGGEAILAFNGNGSMTDRYLWGPAVDQILADERFAPSGSNQMPSSAGTNYWALTDNENSVRDWITYNSLVDHIIYDSFGKIVSHSNSTITFAFGHNGVFYDPATGLEYHSQPSTGTPGRWYNPSIQRWMSEDRAGLSADSNPYRYCANGPTNGTDPTGMSDASDMLACGPAPQGLSFFPISRSHTGTFAIDDTGASPLFSADVSDGGYKLRNALGTAADRLEFVLNLLKNHGNAIERFYKDSVTDVRVLRDKASRDKLIKLIQNILDATNKPSGATVFAIEGGTTKTEGEMFTTFFLNTNWCIGHVIHVRDLFFQDIPDRRRDVMIHELGRFYNSMGEESTGTWNDVLLWDNLISALGESGQVILEIEPTP